MDKLKAHICQYQQEYKTRFFVINYRGVPTKGKKNMTVPLVSGTFKKQSVGWTACPAKALRDGRAYAILFLFVSFVVFVV